MTTVPELKAQLAEQISKLDAVAADMVQTAARAEGLFAVEQLLSIMEQCTAAQDKVEKENERDVIAAMELEQMTPEVKVMFDRMKAMALDVNARHAAIIHERNFRFSTLKDQYQLP